VTVDVSGLDEAKKAFKAFIDDAQRQWSELLHRMRTEAHGEFGREQPVMHVHPRHMGTIGMRRMFPTWSWERGTATQPLPGFARGGTIDMRPYYQRGVTAAPTCKHCLGEIAPGMAGKEEHADCAAIFSFEGRPRSEVVSKLRAVLHELLPHDYALDAETPGRMLAALAELLEGYDDEVDLKTFPLEPASDPGVVVVRDIPFASLCEHHVLPFSGKVSVAYLPRGKVVGLSKIPRLVRALSRRLQTQERLGEQIARTLERGVAAAGVMVVIRSQHSCMCHRGIESPGEMVTCCARGVFLEKPEARAEATALINLR
jgi:GTP cyclohydrolase I